MTKNSTNKITEPNNPFDDIENSLKSKIQKVLEDNPTVDVSELENLIKETIIDAFEGTAATEGFIKYKSELISTTTTTYANGAAKSSIYEELDLEGVWLSQRDGDVRPDHRHMDGVKSIKGTFTFPDGKTKCKHPGATGVAKQDINCRCNIMATKKK